MLNISSDAAVNAYPAWGAYGASKAALRHLSAIWDDELAAEGVRFLSLDPGDMDTPLHALAVPDADPVDAQAAGGRGARARRRDRCRRLPMRQCRDASMIAADRPIQRPRRREAAGRRRATGDVGHAPPRRVRRRSCGPAISWSPTTPRRCRRASPGGTCSSGEAIEVRLAGRALAGARRRQARSPPIVFGAGDYPHAAPSDRPPPPALAPGDRLALGPLRGDGRRACSGHPRLVSLRFDGTPDDIWAGIARHGRPIQYAHVPEPLALWDVWTAIAGPPVAFEPPSAGFVLDWQTLQRDAQTRRRIRDAHARRRHLVHRRRRARRATCRSTSPTTFPPATAARESSALRTDGRRIVAIGTTVVRALEHAAIGGRRGAPGAGLATQRIGRRSRLRVVDAILSGVHESATSHYQLLRAFADRRTLERADETMVARGYPDARIRRLGAHREGGVKMAAGQEPAARLRWAFSESRASPRRSACNPPRSVSPLMTATTAIRRAARPRGRLSWLVSPAPTPRPARRL